MKSKKLITLIVICTIAFAIACKSTKNNTKSIDIELKSDVQMIAAPPVIIYKTTRDYTENVPVILSEDKYDIISYPAPKDVFYKGKLAYPSRLADGFLLDNRGISKNVAFLDYTYEEYSNLVKTPSKELLMKKIIDKDPVNQMYKCGYRNDYNNLTEELNTLIKSGKLSNCEKLN